MSIRSTAEVMDLFNRAFVDRAPALLDDLVDEDCVMESVQPAPRGERVIGRAACLAFRQPLVEDLSTQFTPQEVIVAGDRATIRWYYRFGPGPAEWVEGVNLMRVRAGKIVEALRLTLGEPFPPHRPTGSPRGGHGGTR
ncbi:nuclear transport factor 2 family protein [Nocardia crassostreae]|uniref:nuclear transport factor 2 family protein n=1 Tax=Nocardia crassostreae TaxID=53428 RepID=UPI000831A348|nr:nuclear transport factor 2 family protein [Nocardia crassostreae]